MISRTLLRPGATSCEHFLLDGRMASVDNALSLEVAGLAQRQEAYSLISPNLTYRFDLFDDGDARNCLFIAQCFGDEHAVLLARALFDSTFVRTKRIKVWRDDVLVHEADKSASGPIN